MRGRLIDILNRYGMSIYFYDEMKIHTGQILRPAQYRIEKLEYITIH